MSNKKPFSDKRWNQLMTPTIIGEIEITYEMKKKYLDCDLEDKTITQEEYKILLEALKAKYPSQ